MKYAFGLCLIIVFSGCEELERPNSNQFVVEAFITADEQVSDVKVKETVTLNDEIADTPIPDSEVRLFTSEQEAMLEYSSATSRYVDSNRELSIQVGETYNIEIMVDGVLATATTVVPEKPVGLELTDSILVVPPLALNFTFRTQFQQLFEEERITFSWDAVPGRSYFVVIEHKEETLDPILPNGIPEESLELLSSFRFISAPSEENSFEIIAVALETYGRHVAKVYSVNQEYVDLFNSETQDSRDLNEPPSNVNNGLGIFSAFAVDSLEFEVRREE